MSVDGEKIEIEMIEVLGRSRELKNVHYHYMIAPDFAEVMRQYRRDGSHMVESQ